MKLIKLTTAICFITAIIFLISSCAEEIKKQEYIRNEGQLKSLVDKALEGNTAINDSLSQLTDLSLPVKNEYNKIVVNDFSSLAGNTFYYVLLEHQNPLYNRLAIYDSVLNLYLLNKNLNGILDISHLNIEGFEFLLLKESFLSGDEITINKFHLIKIDSSDVYPVLETFAGIKAPDVEYKQVIVELNSDMLKTLIEGKEKRRDVQKGDVFVYNNSRKQFLSAGNTFRDIVFGVINSNNKTPQFPQIKDSISALESVGIVKSPEGTPVLDIAEGSKKGFTLTLEEGWREINDLVITEFLTRNVKGTKYINTTLGSDITIIQIPFKDSSESFIRHALPQSSKGTYNVRFSQQIESAKDYIQFFEYSCGNKKFLLIFKTSKHTYYRNKDNYERIINSFTMDC